MAMTEEKDTASGIAILRPIGRLDSGNSSQLELMLTNALKEDFKKIVFDLSQLDYISSAGLRVMLLAGKKLRVSGGKVVLVGMQEVVREVFAMSGFLALFPVAGTLEDGLKLF